MKSLAYTFLLLLGAGIANGQAGGATDVEKVLSFETVAVWDGLKAETTILKSGAGAGLWEDTTATDRIRARRLNLDFSKAEGISLWIHSASASGTRIAFVLRSDNTATEEPDYFQQTFQVDWEGWKEVRIPFAKMRILRQPAGLQQINEILIASSGYGIKAGNPKATLVFDAFTLYSGGEQSAAAPEGSTAEKSWTAPVAKQAAATPEPAAKAPKVAAPALSPEALGKALGFEDLAQWSGLKPDTQDRKEGAASGLWENAAENRRVILRSVGGDLSEMKALRLWIHANQSSGSGIVVMLQSENTATDESDFYRANVPVTWSGWKQVEVPLEDFTPARLPRGLDQIDALAIVTGYSGMPPVLPGTSFKLDGLEIIR